MERELQIRKRNVKNQQDKINQYRNQYAHLKAQNTMKIKENENLVKKLAEMTLKNRELSQREKPYKEQIELLESLNKSYSQQISELHSSKEMLLKQIRENSKYVGTNSYQSKRQDQNNYSSMISDLTKIKNTNIGREEIQGIAQR